MTTETNTVIESLADKLAAADLTDAEIDLLRTLLADADDVAGFDTGNWRPILTSSAATKGWSWGESNLGIKAPTPDGYSFGATQTGSFEG